MRLPHITECRDHISQLLLGNSVTPLKLPLQTPEQLPPQISKLPQLAQQYCLNILNQIKSPKLQQKA